VKYIISHDGEISGGRAQIYKVQSAGAQPWQFTHVWHSEDDRLNCCKCSGPLQAMLSSCKHCNAVRRHLKAISKASANSA